MGYHRSQSDPVEALASLAVLLAAALIVVTLWSLVQLGKHVGRAFRRAPRHPALWTLLALSLGLGGGAALLAATAVWQGLAVVLGVAGAITTLLLVLVAITISITSETVLPKEPESLVTTAFKRSWW